MGTRLPSILCPSSSGNKLVAVTRSLVLSLLLLVVFVASCFVVDHSEGDNLEAFQAKAVELRAAAVELKQVRAE